MTLPCVHAITDERVAQLPDLEHRAARLAEAGCALHARGRGLSGRDQYKLATLFSGLAGDIFVNDRVDIALTLETVGIVLGESSLPIDAVRPLVGSDRVIGCSVHDVDGVRRVRDGGAQFVIFGPVYETPTHPDTAPQGLERLAQACGLGLPVIAIGGITIDRATDVRRAGAQGVAAIRALWDTDDPGGTVRQLRRQFDADHD